MNFRVNARHRLNEMIVKRKREKKYRDKIWNSMNLSKINSVQSQQNQKISTVNRDVIEKKQMQTQFQTRKKASKEYLTTTTELEQAEWHPEHIQHLSVEVISNET